MAAIFCARGADEAAGRVVLLANASDSDSLRVARHYCEARGVPAENIVSLPLSAAETISWREFVATLWTPLQAELMRRGWLDAIAMDLTDSVGRRKVATACTSGSSHAASGFNVLLKDVCCTAQMPETGRRIPTFEQTPLPEPVALVK